MHNYFNDNAIYNFLEMKITEISKNKWTLNLITITQLLGWHDAFSTKQEEKLLLGGDKEHKIIFTPNRNYSNK